MTILLKALTTLCSRLACRPIARGACFSAKYKSSFRGVIQLQRTRQLKSKVQIRKDILLRKNILQHYSDMFAEIGGSNMLNVNPID